MLNRFSTPHLALLCSAGLMGILSRPAVCRALQVFLGSLQVFLGSIQCSWVLQEHKHDSHAAHSRTGPLGMLPWERVACAALPRELSWKEISHQRSQER